MPGFGKIVIVHQTSMSAFLTMVDVVERLRATTLKVAESVYAKKMEEIGMRKPDCALVK